MGHPGRSTVLRGVAACSNFFAWVLASEPQPRVHFTLGDTNNKLSTVYVGRLDNHRSGTPLLHVPRKKEGEEVSRTTTQRAVHKPDII